MLIEQSPNSESSSSKYYVHPNPQSCSVCNIKSNDVVFMIKNSQIINLKLCINCRSKRGKSDHQQVVDKPNEDQIKIAENKLLRCSTKFLERNNYPLIKQSMVYVITVDINIDEFEYIGFSSTRIQRIKCHIILTALFYKFNLKCSNSLTSKYSK